MSKHVGAGRLTQYFEILRGMLAPGGGGGLLNHAISSVGGLRLGGRSFIGRYVFPDGELIDVADSIAAMQRAGLEVRDVESWREHYTRTLRAWIRNLEDHWDEAVALAEMARAADLEAVHGPARRSTSPPLTNVHQVLGVVPSADGDSGVPPTRSRWEAIPT